MHPVLTVPTNAAANLRRSAVIAACLGGASVVALAFAEHVAMGLFACAGLALGVLNSWLVQRAVLRYADSLATNKKRRFTLSVLARLAAITLLALGCAVLVRPDGLGVFAGLAVFQLLMVGGASLPLIKELRQS